MYAGTDLETWQRTGCSRRWRAVLYARVYFDKLIMAQRFMDRYKARCRGIDDHYGEWDCCDYK